MDELTLIDVAQCPTCEEYFPESNGEGGTSLIVHALQEHPGELLAANIREAITSAIVR